MTAMPPTPAPDTSTNTNANTNARDNYLADQPWHEHHEQQQIRTRVFQRPPGAMMGASLHELEPGSPGFWLHMHFGSEELFFVVSGTPVLRTGDARHQLAPGDVVFCPEGERGLHTFLNPSDEPARILAVSAGRYPDVVAYPEQGHAWVATRDPDRAPGDPDRPGLIARFQLPEPPDTPTA